MDSIVTPAFPDMFRLRRAAPSAPVAALPAAHMALEGRRWRFWGGAPGTGGGGGMTKLTVGIILVPLARSQCKTLIPNLVSMTHIRGQPGHASCRADGQYAAAAPIEDVCGQLQWAYRIRRG